MSGDDFETIRESATAVLLREQAPGFEVLLLQKHASLNYGGSWVFPGGVAESIDQQVAEHEFGSTERSQIALATVIRETKEETQLAIEADHLTAFSNWLTPKLKIKRYNTLFFIGVLQADLAQQAIQIDAQEIVDWQWVRPADALTKHAAQELNLNGPSYVTLSQLSQYQTANQASRALCNDGITYYEPRGAKTATGVATVYHGDALYTHENINADLLAQDLQPRHRLYMHKDLPWLFEDTR